MKRMFAGGLLFISGFIGVFALVILSVFKPWNYNGIDGFSGFLLGTGTSWFFTLFCLMAVLGLVICLIEAYRKS